MSAVNRAIILAAGQAFQLDGVNKVLIRHPRDGRTILDWALDAFAGKKVTVVVGFRSVQIMQAYPHLDYVINPDWAVTSNAMSLGLALNDEPCYVVSGDIFFERELVERLDQGPPDLALTEARENRPLTAVHCVLRPDDSISETYLGPVRDIRHPEAIGLFKASHPELLRRWKQQCLRHGNLFVGQVLPCDIVPVVSFPRQESTFDEINTPADYLRLARRYHPL
ncbi:MAG TPA: NTP transferase domain-containing protein [Candidatus Nitrosotenuis sp.]|jgi:choline kinase|nr:NTP transferase domain-containing protein [Candidatus Nitrosotenuis sp.]